MRTAPETLRAIALLVEVHGPQALDRQQGLLAAYALRFTAAAIEAGIVAVDPDQQHDANAQ